MHDDTMEKSLKIAIVLTASFFGVEVVGGLISGSLSLLGDSGHMLRDVFGLITTLSAINIAKKIPTKTKTFGYHRLEIFAAFFNGLILFIMSGWIFWKSYFRLLSPKPIESTTMFVIALIGLLINLYVATRLYGSHDVNVRSAFMHVLTDTLSSVAVIFASIWIFFTNQTFVDPILGIIIGIFILYSAFTIVKESICILMDFTPKDVLFDDVIKDIESVKGVDGVHDVHLWSLCSHINIIDAHIYTTEFDMRKIELMKEKIKQKLKKYDIKHTTLEFECEECIRDDKVSEVRH